MAGEQTGGVSGWMVSRAVLYFGITAVIVVWASAVACLACHCLRRKRRAREMAAAEGAAPAEQPPSGGWGAGLPRFFAPTPLPVVVLNPDNATLGLGVKEEQVGAAAAEPPPGDKAAAEQPQPEPVRPWLQRDSRGFMVWPQPQQPWQQRQAWQQRNAWEQQQHVIQMGEAGIWLDPAEAAAAADAQAAEAADKPHHYAGSVSSSGASSSGGSSSGTGSGNAPGTPGGDEASWGCRSTT